jgi:hypothetical protein
LGKDKVQQEAEQNVAVVSEPRAYFVGQGSFFGVSNDSYEDFVSGIQIASDFQDRFVWP